MAFYNVEKLMLALKRTHGLIVIAEPGYGVVSSTIEDFLNEGEELYVIDLEGLRCPAQEVAWRLFLQLSLNPAGTFLIYGDNENFAHPIVQNTLCAAVDPFEERRLMSWRSFNKERRFEFTGKVIFKARTLEKFYQGLQDRCVILDFNRK